MYEFLCSIIVDVAISAGALFMFNAFPMHVVIEGKEKDDPGLKRDTKFWVKASLYYFSILLALSFPLKYILTHHMCIKK